MSTSTVRATCPGCQHPLRIPREHLGKAVKCTKCGTVVRTKAKAEPANRPVVAATVASDAAPYYPPPAAVPQADPYAPPPGYANPEADPLALDLPISSAAKAYAGRGQYRKDGGGSAKYIWMAFGLLMVVATAAAGLFISKKFGQPTVVTAENGGEQEQKPATPAATPTAAPAPTGPIPRRMLFVQVNNYLYLNPLTSASQSGNGQDRTRAVAKQLAYEWRVPSEKDNNQVYVLSDSGNPADARAPYKNVLTETFQKFFDSSREQDRIFVYFGGHAIEKDGKAYLVPMEGDPDDAASLIPLEQFYALLGACKAGQKVMVWDVCRYNPQRGKQRKGSDAMTPELETQLSKAPPGVQVVLTCAAGQNALEFFSQQLSGETSEYSITGSNFLTAASYVAKKNRTAARTLAPTDPLPVQAWVEPIAKRVAEVAATAPEGEDKKRPSQTPKAFGAPPAEAVAYDPAEPPPARFALPTSPKGASPELVAAIRNEIKLPPLLKGEQEDDGLASFPFAADKLADFGSAVSDSQILADKKKYKFEAAVLNAYDMIRKVWKGEAEKGAVKSSEIRRVFQGEVSEAAKKKIKDDQNYPAIAILTLSDVIKELTDLAPGREKASKRWQANYDYALAQAKARLAFMNEYNLLLGQIFTPEVLPALTPKVHTGWALASSEKMKSKKDVKQLVEESQELYAKIIEDYKGTPWELQAKREKGIALGLEWQPYSPGSKTAD